MNETKINKIEPLNVSNKKFDITVGKTIKYFRKFDQEGLKRKLPITQDKLAQAINISRMSVINFENGRTDVPIYRLYSICSCLGVKVDIFLNYVEEQLNLKEIVNEEVSDKTIETILQSDSSLAEKISREWQK